MKSKYINISIILILAFSGCNNRKKGTIQDAFAIKNFKPIINYSSPKELPHNALYLDYKNAIDSGFVIPSKRQTENGRFNFTFKIKNRTNKSGKFYYKIFYHNESYKFPYNHSLAYENFYGSWENIEITFKETPIIDPEDGYVKITDSFRIVGNPRNEKRYFFKQYNDRWKRNPRVGDYSFLLIITTKQGTKKVPDYIQNIALKKNDNFVNPYSFFFNKNNIKIKNLTYIKSQETLTVKAKPNLGNGIYYVKDKFKINIDTVNKTNHCGNSSYYRKNATFEQFIHHISSKAKYYNIPVIEDIIGTDYSLMDYNWNKAFHKDEELIGMRANTAECPCKTVKSDKKNNKIIIHNPGVSYGNWKKENVGVISRHGFTYGKFTLKAKLTELLNDTGIWNGLTNAIWMIYQGGRVRNWNIRRKCNEKGYFSGYFSQSEKERVEVISYSEIDFEILKTVPYCKNYPPVYLPGYHNHENIPDWNVSLPEEVAKHRDDIIVSCTNWDMACPQPESYASGCNTVTYKNKTFYTHRWSDKYKAITEKSYHNDDELFEQPYYFQIEWRPTEIIWRIGPSKNNMRIVGYVNNTVTSIPNNQMLLIVTQEFHTTVWWPGSPFEQQYIPFPENDIKGEILEFTIE